MTFLKHGLLRRFKFLRHHEDGLSILNQVVKKGPCPSQSGFKIGLTPQVPSSFCEDTNKIIFFQVAIFTEYFVNEHLITSERNGISGIPQ